MTIWRAAPLRQDSRATRLPPTPGLVARLFGSGIDRRPAKFRREIYGLVEPAFVAQADHFLDKDRFLLVVEAHEQRLGRIGDAALVHRAIVEELGFVPHLLNDVV